MSGYTAVIVEPRRHPALEFVLTNFSTHLPKDWKILIFHGKDNEDTVYDILQRRNDPTRFLTPIVLDNETIESYHALLMSQAFYKLIPTETILMFNTDSMIVEPNQLADFLTYDYVGAPWKSGPMGKGGLSLRKKSKMLSVLSAVNPFTVNENMYFSMQKVIPLKKPSFEDAQRFVVETAWHNAPFGIHAPWKHLCKEELQHLIKKYPAIEELIAFHSID